MFEKTLGKQSCTVVFSVLQFWCISKDYLGTFRISLEHLTVAWFIETINVFWGTMGLVMLTALPLEWPGKWFTSWVRVRAWHSAETPGVTQSV
jgi:hypothetical protein